MATKRKAGRPAKHQGSLGGNTRKISVTLPAKLVDEIDHQAGELWWTGETTKVSRSEAITFILSRFCAGQKLVKLP